MPDAGIGTTDREYEGQNMREPENLRDGTSWQGRLAENPARVTFAGTVSDPRSAFWGPKLALPCALVIAIGFGVIVFATIRYGSDCRSPQQSIAIGSVVRMAGC